MVKKRIPDHMQLVNPGFGLPRYLIDEIKELCQDKNITIRQWMIEVIEEALIWRKDLLLKKPETYEFKDIDFMLYQKKMLNYKIVF